MLFISAYYQPEFFFKYGRNTTDTIQEYSYNSGSYGNDPTLSIAIPDLHVFDFNDTTAEVSLKIQALYIP